MVALFILAAGCGHKPLLHVVFGSTPAVSTVSGFAIGTWKQGLDASKANYHTGIVGKAYNMAQAFSPILSLRKNGTFVYSFTGDDVHGHWHADNNGLTLQAEDVDGVPREIAEQELQQVQAQPVGRNHPHQDWLSRGTVLESAVRDSRIEVYQDRVRLYTAGPYIKEDGSSFVGTVVWQRLDYQP